MSYLDPQRGSFEAYATGPDRRREGRVAIIRTAKLVCEGCEYPCVLRDVSSEALRVKLYAPLPPSQTRFALEFGEGDKHFVSLVWHRGDEAGLRFDEAHDLLSLLGEKGPFRKRAIRIRVAMPTTILVMGQHARVVIRDISHEGARIETDHYLALDQRIKLMLPSLGEVFATVRWRNTNQYGLAFMQTFRFETMAQIAGRMQPSTAPAAGAPVRDGFAC